MQTVFATTDDISQPGAVGAPYIVALDRAWHPLSFLDENNQAQGLLIDYWRLVGKKMQRKIVFRLVDWQQSLELVREGKAHIHGGLFQSTERDAYLLFSEDLVQLSTRLFASSKLNARNFNDLAKIPVGITRGGYEAEFVRKHFPAIKLKYYNNNEALVRAALDGDVLAFVADYPVGMYYLHTYGSPEQYQVIYTLYTKYLKSAVSKKHGTLLQSLNNTLDTVSREDKANITQKWIRTEKVLPPWLLGSAISLLAILLIAASLIYGVLLKKQVRYKTRELRQEIEESNRLREQNVELVEQLRQQKDAAEEASIAKSRFLAAASHDLRQPLHALTLFTSALDETIQYPKVRNVIKQINASVDALQDLFNALLDISQLDAGVMRYHKTSFSLSSVFDKLANDFMPQARDKNLTIHWPNDNIYIYSDKALLEQILRNYIANAIRYTPQGEVQIQCKINDKCVTISVKDSGVGIPVNQLKSIFNEFYQLNNPERDRSKGLGLGLAIVQRTAKLLGHEIAVSSEPGKGSVFSVEVELGQVQDKPYPMTTPEVESFDQDAVLILVIDDEASVRQGMQCLLESWNCDVITAADGDEALYSLRQIDRAPDAIIADYRLRDHETGIDAIQAIHAEYKQDIPALIVTGDIEVGRLRDVNSSGYQILHKPVAPLKLKTFVRNTSLYKQKNRDINPI